MTKAEFIKNLSEFCEFDQINYAPETTFKSIEGFDSMAMMSIVVFVDDTFNMSFTAKQISELTDFNSLFRLIGDERFDD